MKILIIILFSTLLLIFPNLCKNFFHLSVSRWLIYKLVSIFKTLILLVELWVKILLNLLTRDSRGFTGIYQRKFKALFRLFCFQFVVNLYGIVLPIFHPLKLNEIIMND